MQEINFFLPGFTNNLRINLAFVECLNQHRECFYDNIKIASFFDSFPNAIWNGGRCKFGKIDITKFQKIVDLVNSLGIAIRYTFTNCLIREEHLSDKYCNKLMSISNNGMNEVLVNSPILERYLRSRYPNFKYILSTTTLTRGAQSINELCEKYDLVVADYRDTHNYNFLQEIVRRDKVEIILNESCVLNCAYRRNHYEEISRAQLLFRETAASKRCMYQDTSQFREAYVSTDMLYCMLVPMGYVNYKIRGRESNAIKLTNEYLSFFVKPQYKYDVKKYIEKSSFTNIGWIITS